MPSERRLANALARSASLVLLAATVANGLALPQDTEEDTGDASATATLAATAAASNSASRTSPSASPSPSAHKSGSHHTSLGGKIAAICIPIVFVLFLCWICSPIGPEGKRRRRRREALARLQANLEQREAQDASTRAANEAARAEAAAQENARSHSARQMVYLFTGLRSHQEELPAYNPAPNADEVLLAQGSRAALNVPNSNATTPSEGTTGSPLYPPQVQNAPMSTPASIRETPRPAVPLVVVPAPQRTSYPRNSMPR